MASWSEWFGALLEFCFLIYEFPQNATEERLAWLQLPSGEQLKLLRLSSPAEHVRGAVYDLKAYFYQVKRPMATETRNVVGRAWPGKRLGMRGTGGLQLLLWGSA